MIVLAAASSAPSAKLERGKFLVDHVAMCGDCHTPRNQKGELIQEKYRKGTVLCFKPTAPVPGWADKAPNIAGLPGWEEQRCDQIPEDGACLQRSTGKAYMPQFRLNKEDATAIVTYLRSLGTRSEREWRAELDIAATRSRLTTRSDIVFA